jgi:hypothetical protein
MPAEWDGYCRWLRLAEHRDGSDVLVKFGTNVVTVEDCLSLAPGQWLRDNILHYFTSTMKTTFKIKSADSVFFSSFFLTLLFNGGHANANANVEDTFSYKNIQSWLSKKMKRLKTSLHGSKTLVFFRNVGRMHWATYVIFQDLKIIEEFDSIGPTPSGIILKGLYRWLFLENKRLGIHLDCSKWRLYPTRPSTSRQRNGYNCGVFSIIFALHTGLCLNMNNINQARIPTIRYQMLLHILKKAQPNDNNEVLPVGPDRQEANANNPLVLLSGPEEDSDEGSAHIDGMSDVDGGDDGNYVGETVDAAYNVDNDEEDDASQANDNTDAGDVDAGNNDEDDGGRDQDNAGEDNMLATTRRMEGKTTTRQITMVMLVGVVTKKTMTLETTPMTPTMGKKTKKKRLIWRKTMKMSMLYTKKPKIWNKWLRVSPRLAVYPVVFPPLKYSLT